jgi:hypothetical protein
MIKGERNARLFLLAGTERTCDLTVTASFGIIHAIESKLFLEKGLYL